MVRPLNIIGPGRVGRTLGLLLQRAQQCVVQDVLSAEIATAEAALAVIGAGHAVRTMGELRPADLWLLTPPDAAIAPVAAALAATGRVRPGDIVIHCSGAQPSTILAPLAVIGARVASVHPMKSFADPAVAADTFAGTYCAAEGDAAALQVLNPLFEQLGAHVVVIDPAAKTLYHAASVLVCNGLTALMEAGLRTYESAGLERAIAQPMMEPLVRETLDNVFRLGTARALTGPVARGDAVVLERQLAALTAFDGRIAGAYRALNRLALELARQQGGVSPEKLATVADVLKNINKIKYLQNNIGVPLVVTACYNAPMTEDLRSRMPTATTRAAPLVDPLADPLADPPAAIRNQVLRGIALNREPGYHFAGNFLDLSYDHVGTDGTALSLDVAPYCAEADGQLNVSAMAILADLVMAAAVRAGLASHVRLATVTMNLQLTGAPRSGRLTGRGTMHGFVQGATGRQGASAVEIRNAAGLVCTGSGTFMVLKPPKGVELHPVPLRRRGENPTPEIPGSRLRPDEKKILVAADAALASARTHGGAFIRHFWGVQARHAAGSAQSTVKNGPHIGNRVGHVQGGILLGLAAENAMAALTPHWALTGISAWYISPGEGRALKIRSKIVHHGRLVAVVRTQVTGKGADRRSRKVLEVMTTHAYRAE